MKEPDISVNICGIEFKNPIILASGTCGYGYELINFLDLNNIGGVVLKGISLKPKEGNPRPRIHETPCGLLNSIGLENVGIKAFIKEKLPFLKDINTKIIANILGENIEEYKELAEILEKEAPQVCAIEVNISCPNVKAGGISFGADPKMAAKVTEAVKKATSKPIIIKLSPNVTDITQIAKAVEESGADAISLINTVLGMAIDIYKRKPVLSRVFGGLSGPAIKPIALRMVWQVVRAVNIPVIGIGGISSGNDAIEFLLAGAKAVQIGTATLIDPYIAQKIIDEIVSYMRKMNFNKLSEISLIDN